MVILKKVQDLQEYLSSLRGSGANIGFIPTMGALHAGHLALVQKARQDGMFTVCSIFVNPTQFNDKNDFEKYPISVEADIELLTSTGCDALFLPSVSEVYPNGTEQVKPYNFGVLETVLEGAKRPGHFKGVGQVVGRLLEIVVPTALYMGQKDYQQCLIVRQLIEIMGLSSLKMVICPTTREADGLAMSSRNRRLTEPQRAVAGCIYQCLISIESKKKSTDFATVKKQCEELLAEKGFVTDYVALADARDLTLLNDYRSDIPMVALIAAKIGEIRLIDNILLE